MNVELLRTLTAVNAPAGFEDDVRAVIRAEAEKYADEITEDALGNLIVLRRGDKKKRNSLTDAPVVFAAHMDEVGIIAVDDVNSDGYCRFAFLGGVDVRVALGKQTTLGLIAPGKVWHYLSDSERKTVPSVNSLWLDTQGQNVKKGDYGTFISDFVEFGNGSNLYEPTNQNSACEEPTNLHKTQAPYGAPVLPDPRYVKAKALDDRFGCAVLLTLMQTCPANDTYYVFTVQEETGSRGAPTVVRRLQNGGNVPAPDTVIIIEATTAADFPSRVGADRVCELDKGAVLPFMDGSTIYDRKLWQSLTAIADTNGIKWQTKTRIAGGTDAPSFQRGASGMRVAAISLPTRNIHSPACIAKLSDMNAVLALATAVHNG